MKKQIVLTPEWVFENVPQNQFADGNGNIRVYTNDPTDANLIELAIEALKISFEVDDFYDEDYEISFCFVLRVEDLIEDCPSFYQTMKSMDDSMKFHKNSLKN
jgi:hypothetical protein